ncbi:hypothetical protein SDC9_38256 [bioreactor metagenome]|uniref:Type IV conjugative transfer system protein TraV n=1 Tax=bioreactor metagenome TaxID=1076179 RepID=A0A644VL76_9ZZZZ
MIGISKTVTSVAVAATLFAIAGCSTNTQRDFLCPAQDGLACATIGEADGQSGGGGVVPVKERPTDTLNKELTQAPLTFGKGGKGAPLNAITGMNDGGSSYQATQYRVPEEVGTLWVAPHRDNDGLLYEASFVHFVVREARWATR